MSLAAPPMSRVSRLYAILALAIAGILCTAVPAHASGFLVERGTTVELRRGWRVASCKADVVVRGPHARITVEQIFQNISGRTLEADYVFPLPLGAIVNSITLFEGGKGLEGRLLRADEARRTYEEIVRRRKDPALLQYLGHDIYRVRVFPIPAGQSRKLVLKYDQTLRSDAGLTEFHYLLGSARLSGSSSSSGSASPGSASSGSGSSGSGPQRGGVVPYAAGARVSSRVSLRVDLETRSALGPIYSPTHDVAVTRVSKRRAEISYEGVPQPEVGDFLLYWSTSSRRVGATLLSYWPKDETRGYYLFLASPSVGDTNRVARPKNITFVVDTSGSMAGEKIEQVRAALKQVIPALNRGDHFNVIAYHSSVLPLWEAPRPVTAASIREAVAFVDRMNAAGGTHIEGALRSALAAPVMPDVPCVVAFLTDGRPTMGETDPEKIISMVDRLNPERKVRIFVLGVGVDVNTVMLDRLALANKGVPAFVRPRENVEVKVSALYDKIRYPVLTDVRFAARGMKSSERLPAVVPDLFRGSELVLCGRYARGGPVELVLSGRDGAVEREYHYTLAAARQGQGLRSDFPARVWATRRIAELLDQIRLYKRRDPELVNEIVRLSTKFGILTEYTSFLADESGVSHDELALNTRRARKNLDALAERVVGGAGWAQSANQVTRRGATRAPSPTTGYFLATSGDRDVRRIELGGVRLVGNRTFYYRGPTVGWVDVNVPDAHKPQEVVKRWSPRFFELLRTTTSLENARLSQRGPLLLEIQGRVLRIVDGR